MERREECYGTLWLVLGVTGSRTILHGGGHGYTLLGSKLHTSQLSQTQQVSYNSAGINTYSYLVCIIRVSKVYELCCIQLHCLAHIPSKFDHAWLVCFISLQQTYTRARWYTELPPVCLSYIAHT